MSELVEMNPSWGYKKLVLNKAVSSYYLPAQYNKALSKLQDNVTTEEMEYIISLMTAQGYKPRRYKVCN